MRKKQEFDHVFLNPILCLISSVQFQKNMQHILEQSILCLQSMSVCSIQFPHLSFHVH